MRDRYFVSDENPVNTFTFLQPLCAAATGGTPKPPLMRLPLTPALGLARVCELGWRRLGVPPFLTLAEVYKAGVEHWFTTQRARKELGWKPRVSSEEGMGRVVARCVSVDAVVPVSLRVDTVG